MGACGTGRARPELALAKRWDPGGNIVSPYLWSRGIKALDIVVVTSAAGNLDGFVSILQNFRVGEIWFRDSDAGVASILEEAGRRQVRVRAVSPGEALSLGGTVIELMVPSVTTGTPVSPLVARVVHGNDSAVIAGSLSSLELEQFLKPGSNARSILASTGRRTLVWVAQSALTLAGLSFAKQDSQDSSQDGPAKPSLEPADRGWVPFATDRDGAITVVTRDGTVSVRSFLESNGRGARICGAKSNR